MAFVGRERELAHLAEAVRRVADGGLGRVVITGPSGIGCSTLLDELSRRVLEVPGVTVGRGRAYAPAVGVPYQAVGDALGAALRERDDEGLALVVGDSGHDLSLVVPGLAAQLDDAGIDRLEPPLRAPYLRGRRVVESLLGVCTRLAGDGVFVLMLEDIDEADPATRGFVDILMGVRAALPICLIATYRPDEVNRRHPFRELAARLSGDPDIDRLALGPMRDREIEALAKAAASGRSDRTTIRAVVEGARGNPLVAHQLAVAADRVPGVGLSESFEELTGARLAALGDDARAIVRLVAASRRPVGRDVIAGAAGSRGRHRTISGLDDTLESGLVVPVDGRYAIAHDLYAEAILTLELTPERQRLHTGLAEAAETDAAAGMASADDTLSSSTTVPEPPFHGSRKSPSIANRRTGSSSRSGSSRPRFESSARKPDPS